MPARTRLGKFLAMLLTAWLALAPLAGLAQGAPPVVAPAGSAVGEPRIKASDTVVKFGDPVTILLENGPGLQEGYFVAQAAGLEFNCGGTWRPQCTTPIRIDRNGNASIQARVNSAAAVPVDVIFNFRLRDNSLLPAGVIVRFYHPAHSRPEPPPTAQPILMSKEIDSRYPLGGFYLEGVKADNWLDVCADFKDQPGYIEWTVNGKAFAKDSANNWLCSKPYLNMGNIGGGLTPKPINGQYTIEARAYNPSGASPVLAATFIQVPYSESWFKEVTWIKPPELKGKGDSATYDLEVHLPLQGYRFSAPGFISNRPERKTDAGLTFKGTLSFPVKCKENYDITAHAEGDAFFTNVYLVNAKGHGQVNGSLALRFRTCQLSGAKLVGNLTVDGKADGSKEVKIGDVLIDLFLDPGMIEKILKWLVEFFSDPKMGIAGGLDLRQGFRAGAELQPVSPYLHSSARFYGELGVAGSASIRAGIPELKVTMNAQGTARFDKDGLDRVDNLLFAANALYLVDLSMRIPVINISFGGTIRGVCAYPANGGQSCRKTSSLSAAGDASAWMWTPHPDAAGYAVFQGQPLQTPSLAAGQTVTSVLVSQVYTYVNSALTIDPATGHAIALWDHDDIAKPVGQSLEIMTSSWNGSAWSAPAPLTNDDLMDSLPQIAWTTGGKAAALWHRVARVLSPSATPVITETNEIEIASAGYGPGVTTWTAPALLTVDDVANYGVELAANPDGKLAAVWIRQLDGLVLDASPQPGAVVAAFYDGAWGAPQVVAENIAGLGEVAVGYGAGGATLAYTQRVAPAVAGAADATTTRQVFVAWWDGAQWSAPLPLAPGIHGQRSPNVSFNALAQPVVVWLEDDGVYLRNLTTAIEAMLPLDADHGAPDMMRVVRDGAGNLAAVWRSQGKSFDLHVAWYDQAQGLWSAPRRITNDAAWERLPAAVLSDAGQLRLAYLATSYDAYPGTITLPDGTVVAAPVGAPGLTDLRVLGYTFDRNLTLADDALHLDNPLPAPGETVTLSATLHNTGDLPLANAGVSFYDGNPALGGARITTAPVPGVLAGGAAETVSAGFIVPPNSGIRTFFAVADAANLVTEQDESDNQATLRAFGPDLAFVTAEVLPDWGSGVKLRTQLINQGTAASAPTTLAVFQDGAADAVVTLGIPALAAVASYSLTLPWDHELLAAGLHDVAVIVNADDFDEVDRANNRADLQMPVGADLALSPFNIEIGDMNLAQTPVTVTVVNAGATALANAVLALHNAPARDAVSTLITYTLPSLETGEAVAVNLTVPGPLLCGLYASVTAPEGDIDLLNNYASVAGVAECNVRVFLPHVWR